MRWMPPRSPAWVRQREFDIEASRERQGLTQLVDGPSRADGGRVRAGETSGAVGPVVLSFLRRSLPNLSDETVLRETVLRLCAEDRVGVGVDCPSSQAVEGTDDAQGPLLHDVGVNHCCTHIGMPEQFLHCANIGTRFEQVGSEAMPERMTADGLCNASGEHRLLHGLLQGVLVDVVSHALGRWRG